MQCDFGESFYAALRDRLICGIRSHSMRLKLMAEPNITFLSARQLVLHEEAIATQARAIPHSMCLQWCLSLLRPLLNPVASDNSVKQRRNSIIIKVRINRRRTLALVTAVGGNTMDISVLLVNGSAFLARRWVTFLDCAGQRTRTSPTSNGSTQVLAPSALPLSNHLVSRRKFTEFLEWNFKMRYMPHCNCF